MRALLAAAAAASAAAGGPCAVEQVRLSLGATADRMVVSWATGNESTPAGYSGVVLWGTSPGAMAASPPGDSRNYTINGQASPFLHMAAVGPLAAGQRYVYQVVAAADGPACAPSPLLHFSAPPAVGAHEAYPIRVVGYADMGISHSSNTAAFLTELAAAGGVDLVVQ